MLALSLSQPTPADIGLADAALIELSGVFVMPGLFDARVHLTTEPKPSDIERALSATVVGSHSVAAAGFDQDNSAARSTKAPERR